MSHSRCYPEYADIFGGIGAWSEAGAPAVLEKLDKQKYNIKNKILFDSYETSIMQTVVLKYEFSPHQ